MNSSTNSARYAGLRGFGRQILDKLLLRARVWDTSKTVEVLDRKVDYLQARIDAYAQAEDRIDAELRAEMQERDQRTLRTLANLRRQLEQHRHEMLRELAPPFRNGAGAAIAEEAANTGNADAGRLPDESAASSSEANEADTATQERIASLEAEVAGLSKELRNHISGMSGKLDQSASAIYDTVQRAALHEFRQREATEALLRELHFGLDSKMARSGTEAPDYLLYVHRHIARRRPATVVELGCGVSTLVIAAAMSAHVPDGRVISLDEDEQRAHETRKALNDKGLAEQVEVLHAPLASWSPPRPTSLGTEWQWYQLPSALADLERIDLLLVGGPDKGNAVYGRYPAIPQFRSRMAPGTTVLMNRTKRPDERATATEWSKNWDLRTEFLDNDSATGLAEMTLKSGNGQPGN